MLVDGQHAFDAWVQILSRIIEQGNTVQSQQPTVELCNVLINVHSTRNISAPAEYLSNDKRWIYPTLREIEHLILKPSSKASYTYSYGAKIFGLPGKPNQIDDFIIPLLTKHPQTRRACVFVTQPEDACMENIAHMSSVLSITFFVRNGKLYATLVIRSNEMFLGWPANIFQLFTLANYIANRIEVPVGTLTTFSQSAHVAVDHFDRIRKLIRE